LKEVLFDVKVMIFMWILANFSVIALGKIIFICFKHKLEVKKKFPTFCARVWVLV